MNKAAWAHSLFVLHEDRETVYNDTSVHMLENHGTMYDIIVNHFLS